MQKTFYKVYNETNINEVLKKTKISKKNITLACSKYQIKPYGRTCAFADRMSAHSASTCQLSTVSGNHYFFGPITAPVAPFTVSSVNCIVPSTISPDFLTDSSIMAPDVSTVASTVLPALVNTSLVTFSVPS